MGKMKHIPLLLLAAVLAVGCSQDELFDPAGEGQRPLVIKATGLSVTEAGITRATVDGSWDGDETVAVSVTDDEGTFGVFSYTAASDGTLTSSSPYFWKAQPIEVMAWYPYSAEFPTTVTVDADQSTLEGFKGSDALEASRELTENDCELEFSHRVAKVTFKLKGESTALNGLSDVTVVGVTGVDGGGNSVTPYQPDAAVHTYQVLLAPQTLAAGKTALTLTKDNFTYAWIPDKDYKLEENYSYTFELTIAANKPQITLTGCTISGWELGASYEENVAFPDSGVKVYVNLAELAEEYVINDDECYVFSGSGSYGIKVTGGIPDINLENAQISVSSGHAIDIQGGNPEIYLENAQISVASGNAIDITGGNPTIHVRGENTIGTGRSNNYAAGIYVAQGSSVTIEGSGTSDVLRVTGGTDGAAIGGYSTDVNSNNPCGDITINNVTLYAYASYDYMFNLPIGIGSTGTAACGKIEITDAIVHAWGSGSPGESTPAIGAYSGVPQIVISGSTIHAHRGSFDNYCFADYIGQGGDRYGYQGGQIQCGSGSITGSTVYKYSYDLLTGSSSSDGSVYYDANGNATVR